MSTDEHPQANLLPVPVFRTPVAGGLPRAVPRPGPDVGPRGVQLPARSGGSRLPSVEVRTVRCCGTCKRWNTDKRGEVGLCGLSEPIIIRGARVANPAWKRTELGMIYGANPWSRAEECEDCPEYKEKR